MKSLSRSILFKKSMSKNKDVKSNISIKDANFKLRTKDELKRNRSKAYAYIV